MFCFVFALGRATPRTKRAARSSWTMEYTATPTTRVSSTASGGSRRLEALPARLIQGTDKGREGRCPVAGCCCPFLTCLGGPFCHVLGGAFAFLREGIRRTSTLCNIVRWTHGLCFRRGSVASLSFFSFCIPICLRTRNKTQETHTDA